MPQPRYRFNAGLFRSDAMIYAVASESMLDDDHRPYDEFAVDRVTASFRNELDRYTYKPNMVLTIEPPTTARERDQGGFPIFRWETELPRLQVVMEVPDSRTMTPVVPPRLERAPDGSVRPVMERKMIKVVFTRAIPSDLTFPELSKTDRSERFLWWLRTVLEEMEFHELREWFRVDGELVDDPHAAKTGPANG